MLNNNSSKKQEQQSKKIKKNNDEQTPCSISEKTEYNDDQTPLLYSMPINTNTNSDVFIDKIYKEPQYPSHNVIVQNKEQTLLQEPDTKCYQEADNSVCKYSKLLKLKKSDIQDCIALQEQMLLNMKLKSRSFNFIRKRTEEDFAKMILGEELFGTYDNKDKKLAGIVSIAAIDTKKLLPIFKSNSNILLIDDSLAEMFSYHNGCYLSCLMTSLNQTGTGLAANIMSSAHEIIIEHCYDYSIAEIHVQNPASYKSFIKIDKISFALSNKTVSFVNVNNEKVTIPVSYFVSIHNNNFINIFDKIFKDDQTKQFEY